MNHVPLEAYMHRKSTDLVVFSSPPPWDCFDQSRISYVTLHQYNPNPQLDNFYSNITKHSQYYFHVKDCYSSIV
jgi:hypothetical protein